MLTTDQGYTYAARIDEIINEVLQGHDIGNSENYPGYCSMIRTIRTSLTIMEAANIKHRPLCPECGRPE